MNFWLPKMYLVPKNTFLDTKNVYLIPEMHFFDTKNAFWVPKNAFVDSMFPIGGQFYFSHWPPILFLTASIWSCPVFFLIPQHTKPKLHKSKLPGRKYLPDVRVVVYLGPGHLYGRSDIN